jgi:hypothetical protein
LKPEHAHINLAHILAEFGPKKSTNATASELSTKVVDKFGRNSTKYKVLMKWAQQLHMLNRLGRKTRMWPSECDRNGNETFGWPSNVCTKVFLNILGGLTS